MNALLGVGLGMLVGYVLANYLQRFGFPKVVTFIAVGLCFGPSVLHLVDQAGVQDQGLLMNICLAFIAFEAGGSLKWKQLKAQGKVILWVTILASLLPFILVSGGVFLFASMLPAQLGLSSVDLVKFALLLGALASPTAPAATLAVMHEGHAKGKVTDLLIGVIALDDVFGIFLFSLTISTMMVLEPISGITPSSAFLDGLWTIAGAAAIGALLGWLFVLLPKGIKITGQGQWVVLVFAFLIISTGLAAQLDTDILITCISFGAVVVNFSDHHRQIFQVLERYTEDLIYLLFFLLSGLNLDVSLIQHSAIWIAIFVVLRIAGKYLGAFWGTQRIDKSLSRPSIAGGMLAQAGIVIGLVLGLFQDPNYAEVSPLLLSTIMGSTIVFAFIGPILLKRMLKQVHESK